MCEYVYMYVCVCMCACVCMYLCMCMCEEFSIHKEFNILINILQCVNE